jgi:23S rRNA (cytosine1962-C5)-methyltransferase
VDPHRQKLHPNSAPPHGAPPDDYQLVDFGGGRRLERFGERQVDRPCPGVKEVRPINAAWPQERLVYHRTNAQLGRWTTSGRSDDWLVRLNDLSFLLKATPSGQVGLFPEHRPNWAWITAKLVGAGAQPERLGQEPQGNQTAAALRVLNLFAYTGGSTLAAAAAGASVTHVDASASAVRWARDNAVRSGLGHAPVRWIVDDARKFIQREIRRGVRYDAVVLDPPSYGHGRSGEAWHFRRDLPRLLERCSQVIRERPLFVLLTCHPPAESPHSIHDWLHSQLTRYSLDWSAGWLVLHDAAGRELSSGLVLAGDA